MHVIGGNIGDGSVIGRKPTMHEKSYACREKIVYMKILREQLL